MEEVIPLIGALNIEKAKDDESYTKEEVSILLQEKTEAIESLSEKVNLLTNKLDECYERERALSTQLNILLDEENKLLEPKKSLFKRFSTWFK